MPEPIAAGTQDGLFEPPAPAAPVPEPDRAATRPGRLRTTAGFDLAEHEPVARVQLIGALPHLDRPFDYAVPADAAAAGPGMRVKVRLAGREMDGIVLERTDTPATDRPLGPIARLVSEDVVISPTMLRVCAEVAERCAGTLGDVLRLAIPPRHARAEKADRTAEQAEQEDVPAADEADGPEESDEGGTAEGVEGAGEAGEDDARIIGRYIGLQALVDRAGSAEGPVPRAGIVLEPADAWTQVTAAAISRLAPGRGALVVAPDMRDVDRLHRVLEARGIPHEVLGSADGPEKRYRAFRRILRGASRIVIGSRSAAFAPVRDLALIVCWDAADDLLVEPRAPYPHTRTVLQCRSHEERAALLLLSTSCSTTEAMLAGQGYLRLLEPAGAPLNAVRPRIVAMDDHLREREGPSGRSRLPQAAMRVIREGLGRGSVLVQVPRSGYVPAIACTFCGTRCLCPTCSAPLTLRSRDHGLQCTVCGRVEDGYRCPECHRTGVRAVVIGSTRTAEELRRAFPEAPLVVAGGAHGPVPDDAVPEGAIVVATPGAEPAPEGDYAAAVLLDCDAMLARASFDADVEAVRRWTNAIALVRTARDGGEVLVVGTATLPAIRDLVAHRSRVFLDRVLEDRRQLDLPPFRRIAEVTGDRAAVRTFLEETDLPDGTSVFGPVDLEEGADARGARAVLRLEPQRSRELTEALRAGVAARSARKRPGSLRVRLDPPDVF
ncbi:primosomal protein N' [Brachybacterium phenoliresistens]|uniref:primosomal protein N' family DNA-binding protein n=1 Tax=Brachybacterium phenoliresistens TaxID=396014 RepID=UPI0018DD5306|nr:primosomal protein N' [Brachybacterium phenoliresistens]